MKAWLAKLKVLLGLLKMTAREWYDDNTFLFGAALAYYTVFSLAPILIIAIAATSLAFGRQAAEDQITQEIGNVVGPTVGTAVQEVIRNAWATGSGTLATVISALVLVVGATGVFAELQESLNAIWKVQPKPGRGLWGVVRDRLLSFAVVLCIGFLLLVSLVISAGLAALNKLLTFASLPGTVYLWQAINGVFSFGLITVLFAMIYKILPDVIIDWRDVWIGAAVTALLFTAGKYLISVYLGQGGVASAYGAAGSLVVILLWVYYSSQILLFGAEFTQVYAKHIGKPLLPTRNAVAVVKTVQPQSA